MGLPSKALTRYVLGISETGIACGDAEATLMGETFFGEDPPFQFTGTDTVKTVGCE